MAEKKVVLLEVDIDNSKAVKAQSELLVSIEKVKKEQKELKKETNNLTDATEEQAKAYAENDVKLKALQEESRRYSRVLKDNTKELNKNKKVVTQTNGSTNSLRNALNINRDVYRSLTKAERENTKAGKDLLKLINQQDKEYKELSRSIGNTQVDVGNYGRAVTGLNKVMGALGLAFGISQIVSFGKELNALANESRGVQFAFDRLGESGTSAFEKIKESTRGTLANLDIKRALVEFDNFNISLEETDTLFEFLAVRATQTGKSIDELQSSLVEGLSKGSKQRIDNLGISTAQLNEELKKTPNFVQAVANIAETEIAKAGSILDEAGSAQARWSSEIKNSKEAIANNLGPAFNRFLNLASKGIERLSIGLRNLFESTEQTLARVSKKSNEEGIKQFNTIFNQLKSQAGENAKITEESLSRFTESTLKNEKIKIEKLKTLLKVGGLDRIKLAKQLGIEENKIRTSSLKQSIRVLEDRNEAVRNYVDKNKQFLLTGEKQQLDSIEKVENKISESRSSENEAREKIAAQRKEDADLISQTENDIQTKKLETVRVELNGISEVKTAINEVNRLRVESEQMRLDQLIINGANEFDIRRQQLELEKQQELSNTELTEKEKLNIKSIYAKKEENLEQEKNAVILGSIQNALGDAKSLFEENTAAYKALAIAEASIATYLAATKALTLPPPANVIVPAVTIATGLANVAKIAAFADGTTDAQPLTFSNLTNHTGIIKGTPNISMPNGDNMLATVKTGEAILNEGQQKTINDLIGFDAIRYAVKGYADGTTFTSPTETNSINRNIINNSNINNSSIPTNIEYVVGVKEIIDGVNGYKTKISDASI